MVRDNSPVHFSEFKNADSVPSYSRRGPGARTIPPIDTSISRRLSSMPTFIPKPFPPPSLADVPVEYIIDQLRVLAPNYWDKPETADCTIIIPVPYPPNGTFRSNSFFPCGPQPSIDPSCLGRRATEPSLHFVPRISMKLHTDYLSAHSTFLRALFSGASSFDLINSNPRHNVNSFRPSSGQFSVPEDRLPRLISTSPNHPVLHLPVPDPTSIHLLMHWMYFGSTSFIEDFLDQGIIQWEGIARNAEYLGLNDEMKAFLGTWRRDWLDSEDDRSASSSSDEDSEMACSDDEDDMHDGTSSPDTDLDMEEDEEEPSRGRSRGTRCISWNPDFNFQPPPTDSTST